MKYCLKHIILPFLPVLVFLHNHCDAQCVVTLWSDSTIRIRTAAFLDSTRGILLTSQGKVLWTTNGGITWDDRTGISVEPGEDGMDNVIMFNDSTATIVTLWNIYRTTDAGDTWQLQFTTGSVNFDAAFSDADHGLVISDDGVFHTSDGGSNWHSKNIGTEQTLRGVAYPDSLHATIISQSNIFHTSDGAGSWTPQNNTAGLLNAVSFIDSNRGIIISEPSFSNLRVLYTTNGGNNWERKIVAFTGVYKSLSFVDDQTWIARNGQTVLSTIDGGGHWNVSTLPVNTVSMCFFPSGGTRLAGNAYSNFIYTGKVYSISTGECSPSAAMVHPGNGTTNVTLSHSLTYPNSTSLGWNYKQGNIWGAYSFIQFSSDSTFPLESTLDTIITEYSANYNSLTVKKLSSNTTYYWRLRTQYIDGTSSAWSDTWKFTTAAGMISGVVFDDTDHDGVRDDDEPGLHNIPIYVWSHLEGEVRTDAEGRFSLAGLEPGNYVIEVYIHPSWELTFPQLWYYEFILNADDTVSNIDFGLFFPWNYISGTLFHDENENLVFDSTEHGLESWTVFMRGPVGNDSTTTDADGNYIFNRLTIGTHRITAAGQPSWIQTYPQYQQGYSVTFTAYNQHLNQAVFGFGHSPPKVKNKITVNDSSQTISTSVWWGTRPGAAYGIWSVDPLATSIDFSEGEAEVPPPVPGGFDVRFVDPHLAYEQFGFGSWVDMRNYLSPAQIDTYRITFSPSVSLGGGYPMKFQWSKADVINSYTSCVLLDELSGNTFDMKMLDSLVVENPNTSSLLLIAQSPKLPSTDASGNVLHIPDVFYLGQNYPNPFNPVTVISYMLPVNSYTTLKIYDILGREVVTLFSGQQRKGTHQLSFDASMLPSGVYFYSLGSQKGTQTRKMLLLR